MLKKHDVSDCYVLYELMTSPEVYPFVRYKAESLDQYMFWLKHLNALEEQKKVISRTILEEQGKPIGTISLFDIENKAGFLGTWLGVNYQGKGYNKVAKENFFKELFIQYDIESVYLKIRNNNVKSKKAVEKLTYVKIVNHNKPCLFKQINTNGYVYDLYAISKEDFLMYLNYQEMTSQEA